MKIEKLTKQLKKISSVKDRRFYTSKEVDILFEAWQQGLISSFKEEIDFNGRKVNGLTVVDNK